MPVPGYSTESDAPYANVTTILATPVLRFTDCQKGLAFRSFELSV